MSRENRPLDNSFPHTLFAHTSSLFYVLHTGAKMNSQEQEVGNTRRSGHEEISSNLHGHKIEIPMYVSSYRMRVFVKHKVFKHLFPVDLSRRRGW